MIYSKNTLQSPFARGGDVKKDSGQILDKARTGAGMTRSLVIGHFRSHWVLFGDWNLVIDHSYCLTPSTLR
jgi:hypothetical protein